MPPDRSIYVFVSVYWTYIFKNNQHRFKSLRVVGLYNEFRKKKKVAEKRQSAGTPISDVWVVMRATYHCAMVALAASIALYGHYKSNRYMSRLA